MKTLEWKKRFLTSLAKTGKKFTVNEILRKPQQRREQGQRLIKQFSSFTSVLYKYLSLFVSRLLLNNNIRSPNSEVCDEFEPNL